MNTRLAGWTQLILAITAMVSVIWRMMHGEHLDPTHVAVTGGLAASAAETISRGRLK